MHEESKLNVTVIIFINSMEPLSDLIFPVVMDMAIKWLSCFYSCPWKYTR